MSPARRQFLIAQYRDSARRCRETIQFIKALEAECKERIQFLQRNQKSTQPQTTSA